MPARSDVLTRRQRSYCMSRIRGRDTGPELELRRALFAAGARFRVKTKLPGRPDVVFHGARLAVFVDGCFWHACPLHSTMVRNRAAFWAAKISGNVDRDRRVEGQLAEAGWRVLRIWEHEVKDDAARVAALVMTEVRVRQVEASAAKAARSRRSSAVRGSSAVSSTV